MFSTTISKKSNFKQKEVLAGYVVDDKSDALIDDLDEAQVAVIFDVKALVSLLVVLDAFSEVVDGRITVCVEVVRTGYLHLLLMTHSGHHLLFITFSYSLQVGDIPIQCLKYSKVPPLSTDMHY